MVARAVVVSFLRAATCLRHSLIAAAYLYNSSQDSPRREPQLKRPHYPPVLRQNPTGQGAFNVRRKNSGCVS